MMASESNDEGALGEGLTTDLIKVIIGVGRGILICISIFHNG